MVPDSAPLHVTVYNVVTSPPEATRSTDPTPPAHRASETTTESIDKGAAGSETITSKAALHGGLGLRSSVTITVYVPATRPVNIPLDVAVAPSREYMYPSPVPPVADTSKLPESAPLQETFCRASKLSTSSSKTTMVTVSVWEQVALVLTAHRKIVVPVTRFVTVLLAEVGLGISGEIGPSGKLTTSHAPSP
jgi:hypothetical protein